MLQIRICILLFCLFVLQIDVKADDAELTQQQQQQQQQIDNFNLVNLSHTNPDIILDIRYATSNNFLGFPVYPKPACYLHKEVAQALNQVQSELSSLQLGLKVFDGYRPLSVQQVMWDAIQDERYVSNPAKNKGRHTSTVNQKFCG